MSSSGRALVTISDATLPPAPTLQSNTSRPGRCRGERAEAGQTETQKPANVLSCPISVPCTQDVEPAIDKIETILPPEQLIADDKCWRAEHAELFGLGRELAIETLHRLACLSHEQARPIVAVLLRNCLAHVGSGDIALFGPQGAQDGVRQRQSVEF